MSRPTQIEAKLKEIMRLLSKKESSKKEISALMKIGRSGIAHYVGMLHDKREIHISRYETSRYGATAIYAIGDFPDAEYPFHRKEKEEEPLPTVVIIRRDPLDVALFGEYQKAA